MTKLKTVTMGLPEARRRLVSAQNLLDAAALTQQTLKDDVRPGEKVSATEAAIQLQTLSALASADVICAKVLRQRSATGAISDVRALLEQAEPEGREAALLQQILDTTDALQRFTLVEQLYRDARRAI
jgi:hypothetical protein